MPTTRTSRFHPGFSLPPSQPPRPACPLLSQTCLGPVPAHVAPHCSPSSHSHRVRQTTLLAIEAHTPRLTSRPAPRFLSKCTSCPAVRVLMPQDAERDTLLSRHQRTENPGGGARVLSSLGRSLKHLPGWQCRWHDLRIITFSAPQGQVKL